MVRTIVVGETIPRASACRLRAAAGTFISTRCFVEENPRRDFSSNQTLTVSWAG